MKKRFLLLSVLFTFSLSSLAGAENYKLAYLVSDLDIPFWNTMWRGIEHKAGDTDITVTPYSSNNSAKQELINTTKVIKQKVDGIILSPTSSSSAVTILKLAKKANIPVVIADIGTQGGEYVSLLEFNNTKAGFELGKLLAKEMEAQKLSGGSVGIIAIPQNRKNGHDRTTGFITAMRENGIRMADIRQQEDFSYRETYNYTKELIDLHPEMRALWLQGSHRFQAALDAIKRSQLDHKILLLCYDVEPEFITLIKNKTLIGSGIQQPYLMGEQALNLIEKHLNGISVPKHVTLEVLPVSAHNIDQLTPIIINNVLGHTSDF